MELQPEVEDLNNADELFAAWCDDLDAYCEARYIESEDAIYPLMAAIGIAYALVELDASPLMSPHTRNQQRELLDTYAHLITTLIRNLTDVGFFRQTADGLVIAVPELIG